jgi:hypothetical protein
VRRSPTLLARSKSAFFLSQLVAFRSSRVTARAGLASFVARFVLGFHVHPEAQERETPGFTACTIDNAGLV